MFYDITKFELNFLFIPFFQEAHVNTCYKHFYYFVVEFQLVAEKELEPLVSNSLTHKYSQRAKAS